MQKMSSNKWVIVGIIVGFFVFFMVASDYGTLPGLCVAAVITAVTIISGFAFTKAEKNNDTKFEKKFEEFKIKRGDSDNNTREAEALQSEYAYQLSEYRKKYNPFQAKKRKTLKAELLHLTHDSFIVIGVLFLLGTGAVWLTFNFLYAPFYYNILFGAGGIAFLYFSLNNLAGFYVDRFLDKLKKQGVDIKELESDFMNGKLFYGKRKSMHGDGTSRGLNIGKEYTIGLNAVVGGRLTFIRNSEVTDATRYVVNMKHYLNGAYSHSEIVYRIRIKTNNNKIIEIPLPDEYMLDLAIEAIMEEKS